MIRGLEARRFWAGMALAGLALVLTAAALGGALPVHLTAVASVAALGAIATYEDAFIRAGQAVPLC